MQFQIFCFSLKLIGQRLRREPILEVASLRFLAMFDIKKRSALARSGNWAIGNHSVRLPAIAFAQTQRIKPPKYAEILLSAERVTKNKPTLVDEGSLFSPSSAKGDITIEPDFPFPMSLQDLGTTKKGGKKKEEAVVVHPGKAEHASKAAKKGTRVFVIGNAVELIRHPKAFIKEIAALRDSVGYSSLIYLPGIANPTNLAFLSYCGGDIFDSTRVIWESRSGNILTPEGKWTPPHARDSSCECPVCAEERTFASLLERNYLALQNEIERTRHHISNGTLREFVEKRSVHDSWTIAALRHLDLRYYDYQELHFPMSGAKFSANTKESLFRPDIVRFRRRIRERYRKPSSAKILLLLPCSAKKPYSLSKTHAIFRKTVKDSGNQHLAHEVIVTSPLGIVPRELELFYPAQHYDIPVTGDWSKDEISIVQEDLLDYLKKNAYDEVIVHLGSEKDFVCEILEEHTPTSDDGPTSAKSLTKLTKELSRTGKGFGKGSRSGRKLEDMLSRSVFQFGNAGQELMKSIEIKGRYPSLKIFSKGTQLGMLVGERGMISLTLEGAERISKKNAYCVEIEDFHPEGNIFAVGVTDADKEIRVGDEVIVRHGKDVRCVGTAMMNWKEMIESERGEAVRVRHGKKA